MQFASLFNIFIFFYWMMSIGICRVQCTLAFVFFPFFFLSSVLINIFQKLVCDKHFIFVVEFFIFLLHWLLFLDRCATSEVKLNETQECVCVCCAWDISSFSMHFKHFFLLRFNFSFFWKWKKKQDFSNLIFLIIFDLHVVVFLSSTLCI